jgi:hypothetical protein
MRNFRRRYLNEALRKAPQTGVLGFRLTVTKLLSIVQVRWLAERAVKISYAISQRLGRCQYTKSTLIGTFVEFASLWRVA